MCACACACVCAHTALLPRLLNYEAFSAVVIASSAFGNMSFYFCLGPNIQFEEGSQTIHDLFKKSNGREGKQGMSKMTFPEAPEVTQLTDGVSFVVLDDDDEVDVEEDDGGDDDDDGEVDVDVEEDDGGDDDDVCCFDCLQENDYLHGVP